MITIITANTNAITTVIHNGDVIHNHDQVATVPTFANFNIKNIKNIAVLKLNPLVFLLLFFICYTIHFICQCVKNYFTYIEPTTPIVTNNAMPANAIMNNFNITLSLFIWHTIHHFV